MRVKFVPYHRPSRGLDKKKKMVALFYTDDGRLVRRVAFGSRGSRVYYDHKDEKTMRNYLARHRLRENWNDPYSRGALSRWVLWSKKTSPVAGQRAYASRFGFRLIT